MSRYCLFAIKLKAILPPIFKKCFNDTKTPGKHVFDARNLILNILQRDKGEFNPSFNYETGIDRPRVCTSQLESAGTGKMELTNICK